MVSVKLSTPITGDYVQPTGLFINNEFVKSISGRTIDVINPTDESVICKVYEATEEDVDSAVTAAREAFDNVWSKTPPKERGRYLFRLADEFNKNKELLSAVEALDNGKAYSMALADVSSAEATLRYYAGWADKIHGKVVDTDPGRLNYVKYEPIGVCGQIIPWNFPLLMWAWKIGPAIAAGNTVVMKTAEQTPLSAYIAATLIQKAEFPPGVINVLTGLGKIAGAAISSHMDIDKVAFTGSTAVGRTILKAAAESNLKKVTLELGGKSPNIVFDDVDIEQAISWVNFGIYFNHGQCCCAGSRVYVQEGIYDKFVARFKERAQQNVVGDPFGKETFQGPQVSQLQFDRIMSYIEHGKQDGATVAVGGTRVGDKGYYISPTIFTDVREDMKIVKEEIFGPVCSVSKFKTKEEVIKYANSSNYGLAAAVHTKDLNTAIEVSNALKAGTVWVNQYNMLDPQLPFGGFKESGIGRELGEAALENYMQVKTVSIRLGGPMF